MPPAANRIKATPLAGWRLWALRLAMAVLSPLLFLVLAELALRVCGYGHPSAFLVKSADGSGYVTNASFGRQFLGDDLAGRPWPALLPARKPPGTLRIFVLGESAAMGTPDPSFGFARILEVMLRRKFPARRFEVINAAMRGINSHVVLPPSAAAGHLAAAVRLMPANPVTRIALANCLTKLHRTDETIVQLQEVLRLEPGNASARAGLDALRKRTPAQR